MAIRPDLWLDGRYSSAIRGSYVLTHAVPLRRFPKRGVIKGREIKSWTNLFEPFPTALYPNVDSLPVRRREIAIWP